MSIGCTSGAKVVLNGFVTMGAAAAQNRNNKCQLNFMVLLLIQLVHIASKRVSGFIACNTLQYNNPSYLLRKKQAVISPSVHLSLMISEVAACPPGSYPVVEKKGQ